MAECSLEQEGQQLPRSVTCNLVGQGRTGQEGFVQESLPALQEHCLQEFVASLLVSPSCKVAPCHLQEPQEGQHWPGRGGVGASQGTSHLAWLLVKTPSQHWLSSQTFKLPTGPSLPCSSTVVELSLQSAHSLQHSPSTFGFRL